MLQIDHIRNLINDQLGAGSVITINAMNHKMANLEVYFNKIAEVCTLLHKSPCTYFDYLACLTALDNGPLKNTLEVIYQLYSIPYDFQLMIKVVVARNKPNEPLPEIPSVSHIWQAANWLEREAYDLVGIRFKGHPDLRRILLPDDWQGYPLRQDYSLQKDYHGLTTS